MAAVVEVSEIVPPALAPAFCTALAACGFAALTVPATALLSELTLEPTFEPMLETSCATVLVNRDTRLEDPG